MDIRDWSLDQIMQLPDCALGRRWPIILKGTGAAVAPTFSISPAALPERCVIWELSAEVVEAASIVGSFGLRLGDVLPASAAEFEALEPVFKCFPGTAVPDSDFSLTYYPGFSPVHCKVPIIASGRRLVLGIPASVFTDKNIQVVIAISSVPTEVPDCLFSAIR